MRVKKNTSIKASGDNRESKEKIQLLQCPRHAVSCHSNLTDINRSYSRSNDYQQNKEYQLSIETLRKAFKKTYDLQESSCQQCARFFRSTIIDSLEDMHNELHRMSGSLFRGKRYQGSYALAKNVLNDLKSEDH